MKKEYENQVELLVQCMPVIAEFECFASIEYEKGILSYFLSEDDYYSPKTIIEFEIPFDDVFKIKNIDYLKNYVTENLFTEGFEERGWKEKENN